MMYEHNLKIKIFSGYFLFVESIFILIEISFVFDDILDYRERTCTLQQLYWSLAFIFLLCSSIEIIYYYFLFAIINFNSQKGIQIISRFSKIKATWKEIKSIELTLSLSKRNYSVQGGILLIFLVPFFYHNRIMKIHIKTFSGKEKTIRTYANLKKINLLFEFLTDMKIFNTSYYKIDINEKKKKSKKKKSVKKTEKTKKPRFFDQWRFVQNNSYKNLVVNDIFIRDKNGNIWDKNYSNRAKIILILGIISTICIFTLLFLTALHYEFSQCPTIWNIFLIILLICIIIGLPLAFLTPEIRDNPEFLEI
ncbi:hypothetical protein [Candidatus Harpocratesius sp.]